MMNLPAFVGGTDSQAHFTELRAMQCRTCGAMGPAVDTSDKNNPGHLWDAEHADEFEALGQKHDRFWAWTLTRSAAQTFKLPARRSR